MSSSTNNSGVLLTWLLNFCKLIQSSTPSCPFLNAGNFDPVASSVPALFPKISSPFSPWWCLYFSVLPADRLRRSQHWLEGCTCRLWLPSRTITAHKWIREFLSPDWRCQFSESTCPKSTISPTPISLSHKNPCSPLPSVKLLQKAGGEKCITQSQWFLIQKIQVCIRNY